MRILRNVLLGLLLIVVGIAALMLIPSPQAPAEKPWEVTVMPDGNSRVLGIHLGDTDYKTAQQQLGVFGKTALFVDPDGSLSVEAYFDSINLAGLSAKLIMNLGVSNDKLQAMQSRAGAGELKPSGAHQYELTDQDRQYLLSVPVIGLTYIPSVRLDREMIQSRFGKPARNERSERDENGRVTETWFYPDIGLSVLFQSEQKTLLIYRAKR
ncbi:lytic murein transglycosylase [Methylophaga sp.]|jgi:hypothetical protein|uniref:lytic murein transglycosylase n=1 Tax=Methylophaga sp. TaxID=2024840 RepID=UPI001400F123|nr:lytic murein transglycosylase [Methylophaga sp.]MTI64638.1 lytic murein transglycosylase [Methylophaga sp.]